jgi:hypothetical protein
MLRPFPGGMLLNYEDVARPYYLENVQNVDFGRSISLYLRENIDVFQETGC